MSTTSLAQRFWNYCNVPRDEGMSDGDYVEQLTYRLFLEMADERSRPPLSLLTGQPTPISAQYSLPGLLKKDGDELFDQCQRTLERLGNEQGMLACIFNRAQKQRSCRERLN